MALNVSQAPEGAVQNETDQSLFSSRNRYPHGHLDRAKRVGSLLLGVDPRRGGVGVAGRHASGSSSEVQKSAQQIVRL